MTGDIVSIDFGGLEQLDKKLDLARLIMRDMRPLWEVLASDFYKSMKQTFARKGPGPYQDLSPRYKAAKISRLGFAYPILFASGRLALSLTTRGAQGSVAAISESQMILGTRVPYAKYHHSTAPRRKIPRRPLWDENPDSAMFKRWNRITDEFVKKAIKGAFEGGSQGSRNHRA